MRRALLAPVVLVGCSLQSGGTGDSIDFADASFVARDTGVAVDTGSALRDTEALDTATADAVPEAIDAACPPAKGGARLCDEIAAREALATAQIMDGKPDDFCDVPSVEFDNSKGAIRYPTTTPGAARTTMRIRVAWSSFGLHAHLSVKDPNLLPHKPLSDRRVYLGDGVEIYVAGHDAMTGAFDGTTKDPGAQQIIFTAPDAMTMSRAVYFYGGTAASSPDITRWSARLTTAGYDIELRLPWSELKPAGTPASGKRIALAWALNNKYTATDPNAFSVFQVKTPYPSPTTCLDTASPQPFCDDRLWCTPTLL